jgi:hypothetical protein
MSDELPEGYALVDEVADQSELPEGFTLVDEEIDLGIENMKGVNDDLFHTVTDPLTATVGAVGGAITGGLETIGRVGWGKGLETIGLAPFQGLDAAIKEGQKTQQAISEFTTPTNEAGIASTDFVFDALSQLGKIPSGWGGIAKLITSGSPEEAAQTVKDIEAVGLPRYAGDKVMDKTGSPTLGALTVAVPELASLLLTRKTFGDKAKLTKAKEEIQLIEDMTSGKGDLTELAKYKLENRDKWSAPSKEMVEVLSEKMGVDRDFAKVFAETLPRIEKAKTFPLAIKQEWDQGFLGLIGTSSASDIDVFQNMLKTYKEGTKNQRIKGDTRPIFAAGNAMNSQISFLLEKKNEAGKRVGDAAKDLRGVKLEHEPIIDSFIGKLENEGVTFNNGQPITKASDYNNMDFRDSAFFGSEASEAIIKNAMRRLTSLDSEIDAFHLHNIKKTLRGQISTAKKKEGGLEGHAENILNGLGSDINGLLRRSSDDYRVANDDFIEAITPLNLFNDAMPSNSKIEWDGIDPDKAGLQLRKVFTNYSNAPDLTKAVKNIALTSNKLGGKFTEDALNQVLFSINLDKRLGAYSDQTFQGLNESAQKNVIGSMPLTGSATTDVGIKALSGVMRKVKRVDNERAIKSMEEYLREIKASKTTKTK